MCAGSQNLRIGAVVATGDRMRRTPLSIVAVMWIASGCIESEVGDPVGSADPDDWQSSSEDEPAPETTTTPSLFGAGFCSLAQHGYSHIVANKFATDLGASYFDVVRGDAYVRELEVCIGTSAGQGGTWVLPANVESTTGEIYQLGFGRGAGRLGNTFVYALGSPSAIEIRDVSPVDGHRYRFEIFRHAPGNTVSYRITDLSASATVWSFDSSHAWSTAADHAWWGFETWDSASHHGVSAGKPGINMSFLGYSTNTENLIRYRSGMTCADIWKNFTWDGSSEHNGCSGKRRGPVGTWTYGGDMLDAITY
jgi:hypothetical protein